MPHFLVNLPIGEYYCGACPFFKRILHNEDPPQCLLFRVSIADKTRCDQCRETFVAVTNDWMIR